MGDDVLAASDKNPRGRLAFAPAAGGDPVEHQLAKQMAEPAKKRRKGTSPTQRTLAECRRRGWTAQVVEKWNPHARVRQDLFGVIDIVAIAPPDGPLGHARIVGIQACAGAGGDHAARRAKIIEEPRALAWREAGGHIELWSWGKRGAGKRKLWTLRRETFGISTDGKLFGIEGTAP